MFSNLVFTFCFSWVALKEHHEPLVRCYAFPCGGELLVRTHACRTQWVYKDEVVV